MTAQSPQPIDLFQSWLADARVSEINDPDAACIASVDEQGMPNARMVLIRQVDARGFVFFTNHQGKKGRELLAHPKAALCFHWKTLHRQVRIQGNVEVTSDAEADAYFNSRHRSSRIAAWASKQSEVLPNRETLEQRVAEFEEKFKGVENPPRPKHWSGFRIIPERIEFWQQGEFRLHERKVYIRSGDTWNTELLYP